MNLGPYDISLLKGTIRGQVLLPDDAGFDAAARPWNTAVDQQPLAIIEVADAEDVSMVVRFAQRVGAPITVQPGGHGATGAATGSILIRTGQLASVSVDRETGIAAVGAGVRAGTLQAAAARRGMTALAGSSPGVNVVALILGGGLSWFGRKYGWIADSAVAFEIVTPEGERRRITQEIDPDMFWALRGGGGRGAIVTMVEIALHAAPRFAGGRILWSGEHGAAVMRAFADVTRDASEDLTVWLEVLNFPGAPTMVAWDVAFLGTQDALRETLAVLASLPEPLRNSVAEMSLADIGDIAQEPLDPAPGITRFELLREFSDTVIDELLTNDPAPAMITQVRQLGGRFASSTDNPLGRLDAPFSVSLFSSPQDNADAEVIRARHARMVAKLPVTGRKVPTFLENGDRSDAVYAADSLARLRSIVTQRDPEGRIRTEHEL